MTARLLHHSGHMATLRLKGKAKAAAIKVERKPEVGRPGSHTRGLKKAEEGGIMDKAQEGEVGEGNSVKEVNEEESLEDFLRRTRTHWGLEEDGKDTMVENDSSDGF